MLRGPSISELVLSTEDVGFTGIDRPSVIIALSQEGIDRRKNIFNQIDKNTLIIKVPGVTLPPSNAKIHRVDLKSQKIKSADWATAAIAILAKHKRVLSPQMLQAALEIRFKEKVLATAKELVARVKA